MARAETFELSRLALLDLRMILQESEDRWGPEQSAEYAAALDAACRHVAAFPDIRRSRPRLRKAMLFPTGQHLVLYRKRADDVLILRIVHQRRSLRGLDLDS